MKPGTPNLTQEPLNEATFRYSQIDNPVKAFAVGQMPFLAT
jgi:hypothetical protein